MIERPQISVIMPVFNGERHIRDAVRSVQSQTMGDWELIIVDDESTDGTLRAIQPLSDSDSRITVLQQHHKRQGAARNLGLHYAQGRYIYFMDADDLLEPETFATAINHLRDARCDMLLFSASSFTDDRHLTSRINEYDHYYDRHVSEPTMMTGQEALLHILQRGDFVPSVPLQITTSDMLHDVRFPEDIIYEDNVFTLQVLLKAQSVCVCNDRLYRRRLHGLSTTNASHPDYALRLASYWQVAEYFRSFISDNPSNDRIRKALLPTLRSFYTHAAESARHLLMEGQTDAVDSWLNRCSASDPYASLLLGDDQGLLINALAWKQDAEHQHALLMQITESRAWHVITAFRNWRRKIRPDRIFRRFKIHVSH